MIYYVEYLVLGEYRNEEKKGYYKEEDISLYFHSDWQMVKVGDESGDSGKLIEIKSV